MFARNQFRASSYFENVYHAFKIIKFTLLRRGAQSALKRQLKDIMVTENQAHNESKILYVINIQRKILNNDII